MKNLIKGIICLLATVSAGMTTLRAQSFLAYGSSDVSITVVLKADGSCAITNESVQPRRMLEMQVNSFSRYAAMSEGNDEESDSAPPPPEGSKKTQKTYTDEELSKGIRDMYENRTGYGDEEGATIQQIEITTNSVRVVSSRALSSLKDLLSSSFWSWGPAGMMFDNAVAETRADGQFQLSFSPSKNAERYARSTQREMKSTKSKQSWTLILPGKILSSGFPETKGNQTGFSINPEQPGTVEAAARLMTNHVVVTAEAGGLKLAEALDSKKLARSTPRMNREEPDVAITDAGPGFLAEPVGLTISTVYSFPEGEKLAKDGTTGYYGNEEPGVVVSAKLFPPKPRLIKSVSELKVTKATDDQGRDIVEQKPDSEDEEISYSRTYSSSGDDATGTASIELRIGLPAADALTIEAVEAEAVALTYGGWKEMLLTNVQADAKAPIDLGTVLPGAKLTVKKVTAKAPQTTIEALLEGPAEISQVEIKIKPSSEERGSSSSYMSDRGRPAKGKRNLTIQAHEFNFGGAKPAAKPVTLIVRFPQDIKRERVKFKLSALDLL